MDGQALERILDLAVRLVQQRHDPQRVAACWPAHEQALRRLLPVAQTLHWSAVQAAAHLRAGTERWPPIEWGTVLAAVPRADRARAAAQ